MTTTRSYRNLRFASAQYIRKCGAAMAAKKARSILWLLSLVAYALLAAPAAHAQDFGCSPAMANDIVCENSKPGTPDSVWQINGTGDSTIQGFATDISFSQGQTVSFKISTDAPDYHLDIYRMGYYGGNGARLITTIGPSVALPQNQPECLTDPATKLFDCGNWAVSASWNIPANATSGIYFALLTRTDTGGSSHIVFIVRNDSSHSDILYQTSDETWQAYNNYGGNSLYGDQGFNLPNRAYKVSYNRPFATRNLEVNSWVFAAEYPMVRWLEANGYDVTYTTHIDGVRNASLIANHKIFTSNGHDEYWSGPLRANVEAARDAGVNLAFFSGNEVFWKTRWETSIDGSGTPYRTLVCYKETLAGVRLDPLAPNVWTGTWRDPRFSPPGDGGRPENALTGTIFEVNGPGSDNDNLPIQVPAADGKMRFWRNTTIAGLSAGQTAILPAGTLGYEWDVTDDNGARPAGLVQLSTTTQNLTTDYLLDYGGVYGPGTATHHMSLYRAPSGALVFGSGTVQWSWGLDGNHDITPSTPSTDMQQATVNLLADMGVQPASIQDGLQPATQSTDSTAPSSTILSPASGSTVILGAPVTISGSALDSGGGVVGGVEISSDNGHSWHPASGRENWTYTFTPAQTGPATLMSRAVDDSGNLETPGSGIALTVIGPYSISGNINPPGSGVTVTLGGAVSATTTPDGSGNYIFAGLDNGDYSVTPSGTGYLFNPVSSFVTIAGGNAGVNFALQTAGTTYSISGIITPAAGAAGVEITLSGSASGTTCVDASGAFHFPDLPNGSYTITPSRANRVFSPSQRSITIAGASVSGITFLVATPQTLFTTQVPANSYNDEANIELGTLLQSDVSGQITALRFWKSPSETGTHIGRIWSATGDLLASATFLNETASGWQQQALNSPISIAANTTYVVSVTTSNFFYVATNSELAAQVVHGDLRSVTGNNGVFGPAAQFPTNSYLNTNYYRDVVFVAFPSSNLTAISLSTNNVLGGTSLSGTITVDSPAPQGGAAVALSSDQPAATVPATATVLEGNTTATFSVDTIPVAATASVTITGTLNTTRTAALTVNAAVLASVSLNPATVTGGNSSTGMAILNGPAPAGGAAVALSDDNPAAGVPANVVVPEGATGATFTVTTTGVGATTVATISGNYNGAQAGTLTIDAPALSALSLNPATVTGGSASTATVTLNGPAPAGGALVILSDDNAASSVPASIVVPEGATSATFTVTTIPVGASSVATISGSYNGTQTGTLTIDAPTLSALSLNPTTVPGGSASTATVTLNGPAPAGGAVVNLSSDQIAASVPATVAVAEGATTATFSINTIAVATNLSATITGTLNGTQTASLTVDAPVIVGVSLNPAEVVGGTSSTGTVTLSSPAPAGGAAVALSSDQTPVSVPATATVPEGATTATFSVGTVAVGTNLSATITGTLNGTQTASLIVDAPVIVSVSLNPAEVVGGTSSTGTVTLSSPAPASGAAVNLSTDRAAASVPANVVVLAGSTSVTFTVTTTAVSASTVATISGSYNGTQAGTLTIDAPTLSALSLNPTTVPGGSASTATVTLNGPAPAGGAVVNLSSDQIAASVPATVAVAEGATTATFSINTIAVATNLSATITGTLNGTQTASLTVDAPVIVGVSLNPAEVVGGTSSTGTVTLSSPAPAGGAAVALSSDQTPVSVPATATVPEGATTATFSVGTVAVGTNLSATITGTLNGTQTASLTVDTPVIVSVSLNPAEVIGGTSSTGTVTLSSPAPAGGAIVAISDDDEDAIIPAAVVVPGGATSATFLVGTNPVIDAYTATIAGTYNGTQFGLLTLDAAGLASVSMNPSSLAGGNSATGTVTLSGAAPAGGIVVALSNNLPSTPGVQGVYSPAGLPQGGTVDWANAGPEYSSIDSGTVFPVTGIPNLNMTVSNSTGLPLMTLNNCAAGGNCGWYGNFAPGASLLWTSGTYDGNTGWWGANGPMVLSLNSPQHGIGMQIMPDESGPFTATVCAYDASNTLLGCIPFHGNAADGADGSAIFVGVYDDVAEISSITIDDGGPLYPHDLAIGQVFVANARRPTMPTSITVPTGATSANFSFSAGAVSTATAVTIGGSYSGITQTGTLTINPPALTAVSVNPASVAGGASATGTVSLNGIAPAGGVIVTLSADNGEISSAQAVTGINDLPQDGSVNWSDVGPTFTSIDPGTVVPVNGISGLNVTISTSNGLPGMILKNCPEASGDCAWAGNFPQAAPLLWVGGNYDDNGNWSANGPMILTLSAPQRGLGFRIMADEAGPFSGTACAYNADDVLVGCAPFSGSGAALAGGSNGIAAYVGVYDDTAEIAKVTIDCGGALYPHDFAIGQLFIASSRRMVPSTVKVQAGATTADFPVNTDHSGAQNTVTLTGNEQTTTTTTLTVTP